MTAFKKLVIFLAAFTLMRLIVAGSFELALDDGYYWLWSQHLSLSYFDHPPMVALVIAATTAFGQSEFFVRLGAVIGAVFATILLYRLTSRLYKSEEAGWHSAWILNLSLIFCAGALEVTPDTPLVPFYLLAMLLFYDAANAKNGEWGKWTATGAAIGLAMLSKYTAVFFFPGALLYLFLSPGKRGWLLRPHPWAAAVVAALVFSPVIIWNMQHGWISISFQAKHGLEQVQGNPLGRFFEYAGFQMILYSIGIFFFLAAAAVDSVKTSFTGSSHGTSDTTVDANRFLFSFWMPSLLFFTLNSFRATVEGNWPILGFVPLFALAGGLAPGWFQNPRLKKPLMASIAAAVLLIAFFHIQIVDPVIPHPKRYEISRRVFGWKKLGHEVDAERGTFPAKFIVADRHQIAGLLTYYTTPHLPAYLIGGYNRLRYTFLPTVDSYTGSDALYVVEEERDNSTALQKVFERIEKARTVVIERKGELIRRFLIYRCYNSRGGLSDIE